MRPFTQFLKPRRKRNLRLKRVRNVNLLQKSLSIILNPYHLLQLALLSRRSHTNRISSKKKRFPNRLKTSKGRSPPSGGFKSSRPRAWQRPCARRLPCAPSERQQGYSAHVSISFKKKKKFLKTLKRRQSFFAHELFSSKKQSLLKRLKKIQSHTAHLSHIQKCSLSNTESHFML